MAQKRICSFEIDDRIFHRDAIMKTAYLFIDDYYVHLAYAREHFIQVLIEPKQDKSKDEIDKRFCNELLGQMLRYRIAKENKGMKELIVGRALYSTCIQTEDDVFEDDQDLTSGYSLEDIAVNWFDVYE